jgi:hypothetical protein
MAPLLAGVPLSLRSHACLLCPSVATRGRGDRPTDPLLAVPTDGRTADGDGRPGSDDCATAQRQRGVWAPPGHMRRGGGGKRSLGGGGTGLTTVVRCTKTAKPQPHASRLPPALHSKVSTLVYANLRRCVAAKTF